MTLYGWPARWSCHRSGNLQSISQSIFVYYMVVRPQPLTKTQLKVHTYMKTMS